MPYSFLFRIVQPSTMVVGALLSANILSAETATAQDSVTTERPAPARPAASGQTGAPKQASPTKSADTQDGEADASEADGAGKEDTAGESTSASDEEAQSEVTEAADDADDAASTEQQDAALSTVEPTADEADGAPVADSADDEGWMNLKAESEPPAPPKKAPSSYFRTMVLIEGTAKYGAMTIANPGSTLEGDETEVVTHRAGNLGGQATLGVMPGGSAFTMAGRLRGGSYIGDEVTRGNVAAEMLFGANFARNARGTEFTHVMGGFGVEFLPAENQDLLTLSVTGGTVVKGVSFGAGINLGANDEFAIATFGMQIGWGQLF